MSVLERMDEGLKVLECLLPAYFKVDIIVVIIMIIIIITIVIIIIFVLVFCLPSSR